MRMVAFILAALPLLAGNGSVTTAVRGHTFTLPRLSPTSTKADMAVIFLPGDGGWRGAAVSIAQAIASWGYDVYGFDTKKYLEAFSENGGKLTRQELAADVRLIASQISGPSHRRVALVGWSQGASMAIAAVSAVKASPIQGVVTLGLPESGVLGWDWRATLAIIAHREPDQPTFQVRPLLPGTSRTPVWMIHGGEDEYTTPEVARSLFQAASGPKHLEEISGARHRFDGHKDELYGSIRKGLAWVVSN